MSKLSSDGLILLGSTLVGGSNNDGVNYNTNTGLVDSLTTNYGDQFRGEIMLDAANNVIVASCTRSVDFPVLNAFQPANAGGQDGVVFKLSTDLSTLIWSSYYGGSNNDACYSVKVDNSDNVIFGGGTASNDLIGMTGWQSSYGGGKTDGYIVKLPGDGSSIIGGTYVGTGNYDQGFFVEVDRVNQIYMVGQSQNGSFPVINSPFVNPGSSQFIIRFDSTLVTALNSTVFGSGNNAMDISPSAFLIDICGNIYISGWGKALSGGVPALGMPITSDAFQSTTVNPDFYLLVIERDFADTLYGTYIGGGQAGEHVDGGTSRFDEQGVVYQSVCGGCNGYSDFTTTTGAWSATNDADNCNNLVFKFDFEIIPKAEFTIDDNIGCRPFTVTFSNTSNVTDTYLWDFGDGDTSSVDFNPVIVYDSVGVFTTFLYVTDSICMLTDTAEVFITVFDSLELWTSSDIEVCIPEPIDLTSFTNGTGNTFVWSSSVNFNDTLNSNIYDSIWSFTPSVSAMYYIRTENIGCNKIDSVNVNMQILPVAYFVVDDTAGCVPITVSFNNLSTIPDSHEWDYGNGFGSGDLDPTVTYNTPGVYIALLTVENTFCNIIDSAEITITILDSVDLNVPLDQVMCDPIALQLEALTNGTANNFIWSTNINFSDTLNSNVLDSTYLSTPTVPTVFYIHASNSECFKIDSVSVTFQSALIDLTSNDSICDDESTWVYSEVTSPNITFSNYVWSPDSIIVSANNQTSIEVAPNETQYVYLTALSSTGCSISDSIQIFVGNIPQNAVVASSSEYTVPEGAEVTLYGEPSGYSYSWFPPNLVDQPTSQETTATLEQTTLFTLFISDGICTKSDTVLVTVYEFLCDDPYLYVPNAFTPNGDGENDVLYVRGPAIQEMVFRIFDRLGEMVFESFERPFGWDGTFRGKLMNPDVYDYYLKVTCIDQVETIIKGNFQLIR